MLSFQDTFRKSTLSRLGPLLEIDGLVGELGAVEVSLPGGSGCTVAQYTLKAHWSIAVCVGSAVGPTCL